MAKLQTDAMLRWWSTQMDVSARIIEIVGPNALNVP